MDEDSTLLFMKVMCVVAWVYIAAALACCLPWLLGICKTGSTQVPQRRKDEKLIPSETAQQVESV